MFEIFALFCALKPCFDGVFGVEAAASINVKHVWRVLFELKEELVAFVVDDLVGVFRHTCSQYVLLLYRRCGNLPPGQVLHAQSKISTNGNE